MRVFPALVLGMLIGGPAAQAQTSRDVLNLQGRITDQPGVVDTG